MGGKREKLINREKMAVEEKKKTEIRMRAK